MASWGLRPLLISTSLEVFLTDQTLPEFNLQTNHITFCCPEYSNNFLHNLVNLTWLHVLLSLVSWRVHLCCQGMQISGKCKRLGDKSYKNCFKLPPGMWRWGTRGAVPGMTEIQDFTSSFPTSFHKSQPYRGGHRENQLNSRNKPKRRKAAFSK